MASFTIIVAILLCVFVAMIRAAASGSCNEMKVDKESYRTNDLLTATWKVPNPAELTADDDFDVVVRQCDAFVRSSCKDSRYIIPGKNPVTTLTREQFLSGTASFTIPESWDTHEHVYLSLESARHNKTGPLVHERYLYCLGDSSFEFTSTALRLAMKKPRAGAAIKYLAPTTVEWTKTGGNGNDVVLVDLLIDGQEPLRVGASPGTDVQIVLEPTVPTGPAKLRIFWAENAEVAAEVDVEITEADKYFRITTPTAQDKFDAGQENIRIAWEGHNIPADANVVLSLANANNQLTPIGNAMGSTGEFMWTIDSSHSDAGQYRIHIAWEDVTSEGERFLIQGTQVGECSVTGQNILHHQVAVCERGEDQALMATESLQIMKVKLEWLWCLGDFIGGNPGSGVQQGTDYMRVIVQYVGVSRSGIAQTVVQTTNDASRTLKPLRTKEHGTDLHIRMNNMEWRDSGEDKEFCADFEMLPYDTAKNPSGPPGLTLATGLCLKTEDPSCLCDPEDKTSECENGKRIDEVECEECGLSGEGNLVPQPRASQYQLGDKLCSAGNIIVIFNTHCVYTGPQTILYEVDKATTELAVVDATELPGCNEEYWIKVDSTRGTGWALVAELKLCKARTLDPVKFMQEQSAASHLVSWASVATLAAWIALLL